MILMDFFCCSSFVLSAFLFRVQEEFLTIFCSFIFMSCLGLYFFGSVLSLCSELCSKNGQSLGIFQRNVLLFSLYRRVVQGSAV